MLVRIALLVLAFMMYWFLSVASSFPAVSDGKAFLIIVLQVCTGLFALWQTWGCVIALSRLVHPEAYETS